MNDDAQIAAWRQQWQSGPEPGETSYEEERLRQRIDRESRLIRLGLIAPLLVTICIGGYIVVRAVMSGKPTDILLAVEGWIFITVMWVSSLWFARGTWSPLGQTTAAFVDLAIRRCQSSLKASRMGMWFYGGQLVTVCLLMSAMKEAPPRLIPLLTSWPVILIGWIGLPAYILWMRWFQRARRRELARLLELKRQLTEPVS